MKQRMPEIVAGFVGGALVAAAGCVALVRSFEKRINVHAGAE